MSMPQGGEPGQPRDTTPQAGAGQQWEDTPGQGGPPQGGPGQGAPPQGGQGQGGMPPPGQQPYGQPQYGQPQYGNAPGYGEQYAPPGQPGGGPMMGRPISPVNEMETRVTGRRVVQYIIDAILFGIITAVVSWALDRGHGGVHAVLYIVLIVIDVIWYILYWAYWPFSRNGQTVGMQVMGLRVISRDGGAASFAQLVLRSILLVLFTPLSLLVGIITMMFSRYRQRVGDHIAKTLVVRSSVEPVQAPREYAGAGQAGTR
jgi:uncharacterized RDD family membrane protein YckC